MTRAQWIELAAVIALDLLVVVVVVAYALLQP